MVTPEDDKKLSTTVDADQVAEKQLETLISASESGDQLLGAAGYSSDLESVEVMLDDQSDLVDLDALFDALNVVARSGSDAITVVEDGNSNTTLTVNAELLSSVIVDDLDDHSAAALKDQVISDES